VRFKTLLVITILLLTFSIARLPADEIDYGSMWLNIPQDLRRSLAKGIMSGLEAAEGAIYLAWERPGDIAPYGAWQQGANDFRKALYSFLYGERTEIISLDELIARLDAFYFRPGHSATDLWQATFLVLISRNVPNWPITNAMRLHRKSPVEAKDGTSP